MNWRNAKYAFPGQDTIECEIEHPEYGWIPFGCSVSEQPDLHAEMVASGQVAAADPLPDGINIAVDN